jgi:hypothetical protein
MGQSSSTMYQVQSNITMDLARVVVLWPRKVLGKNRVPLDNYFSIVEAKNQTLKTLKRFAG